MTDIWVHRNPATLHGRYVRVLVWATAPTTKALVVDCDKEGTPKAGAKPEYVSVRNLRVPM